ncbi:hypothetical protein F4777DRAFT_574969 [Nemania sp. FL0916]|nr:hypothetical protein F4777DRAFT_574969 [Nemania sp. FL0916]
MLRSTSSASASNDGPASASTSAPALASVPASASAFAPVSAAASTEPSLILHQQISTSTDTSISAVAGTAATVYFPAPATAPVPELEASPLPSNYAPHYKRGPSLSLDGKPSDSLSPLLGSQSSLPAISQDQRIKKRRIGTGSRGVSSLTPEQLAKKRASDRDAQRAIRERTKKQIESLEDKIRELTQQKPYQELEKVVLQKEAAEAKNAELKAFLASIVTSIQTFLSKDTAAEGAFTLPVPNPESVQPSQQQELSPYSAQHSSTTGNESKSHSVAYSSWDSPSCSPSTLGSHEVNSSAQQRHDYVSSLSIDSVEPKYEELLNQIQKTAIEAQDSLVYQQPYDWVASTHDSNTTTSSSLLPPPPPPQQHQCVDYMPDPSNPPHVVWVGSRVPMQHVAATCPYDNLILSFMYERRKLAAQGATPQEVVGPKYPSIKSLLNPHENIPSHPVSKVSTDILSKFSAVNRLPERVAVLYVMHRMMRWQISPTPENFELLPPFSQPTDLQYSKPHPAWVDYVPFPAMREAFINNYQSPEYNFEVIFIPYTQTLSLNWPYEEDDVLLRASSDSEITINPEFQRHLLKLENWTLGDAFYNASPALRGTYNLKSDSGISHGKEPGL